MNKEKTAKFAVALFFAVLLAAGLLACGDYGVACDENWERITLQENMHEYAVRLLGGESEAARWYRARGIGRISQSTEQDHGQSAYYLFMPILERFGDEPHVIQTLWQAYTWLWFMAGVWAIYGFCRQTGLNRFISCIGSLLLYLCPRFFAEAHYNNKDVVLLCLVLLTLWLGARFLRKTTLPRGLLFSLLGALAANTKIAGALAWGVMGLAACVLVTAEKRWSKRMAGTAACTIALFFAFYIALTPASWSGPWSYFKYLVVNAVGFSRWPGVIIFRGMRFDQAVQPLPRYYLIWMIVVTLPLYVIPLAAAGQIGALMRVWKQKAQALRDPASLSLTAASLCWFLPLLAAVVLRPVMYNGWRHFYFVYAGMVLLAAHGVSACYRFCRHFGGDCGMHVVFLAGLLLFFGWTGNDMIKNHPYQYAYYNLLGHRNAAEEMETDYWVVSSFNAMETLLESERDERLPLVLGAQDPMSINGLGWSYAALEPQQKERLTIAEDGNAPYLMANTTYANLYSTSPPDGYHELFTLKSYDISICTVYEKD